MTSAEINHIINNLSTVTNHLNTPLGYLKIQTKQNEKTLTARNRLTGFFRNLSQELIA